MSRLSVVALGLLLTVPALGAAPASSPLDDARALAGELADASPAQALERLAREAGWPAAPAVVAAPDGFARAGLDPEDLPAELRQPVGRLLAAVHTAERMRVEALAGLTPDELTLLADPFATKLSAVAPVGTGARVTPVERVLPQDRLVALAGKVDMALMASAGLVVLEAVELALPELRAAVPAGVDVPPPGCPLATPSIFDDTAGRLAIDGTGGATFEKDYLITIDLGGNDCYTNTAGGAVSGVRVAIDLGGDDQYLRTSTTANVVAQGAASLGVGVLVDAAGDDLYVAASLRSGPQPGPAAPAATVVAQGAGTLGVGVLVDGLGRDSFSATASSSGGGATTVAQGGGSLGAGLLIQGGGATTAAVPDPSSTYTARSVSTLHQTFATPQEQHYVMGAGATYAQGGASVGAGGLVDGAGSDSYEATADGFTGAVAAQGGGAVGAGVLVDGGGADTYHAAARGDITLSLIVGDAGFCWGLFVDVFTFATSTIAQGGAETGLGVLADAGTEANTLTAEAFSRAVAIAEVALSASAFCPNEAVATARTGDARVTAQGAGLLGGGVILGGAGADTYAVSARSEAVARALVNHGTIAREDATAVSGVARTNNHGMTQLGAGIIADAAGGDRYATAATTSATETTHAGTVAGTSGGTDVRHLGLALTGVAWLLDLGGMDTYELNGLPVAFAGDNKCWTHPMSPPGTANNARGRDVPPVPLPAGCP